MPVKLISPLHFLDRGRKNKHTRKYLKYGFRCFTGNDY